MRVPLKLRFRPDCWLKHEKYHTFRHFSVYQELQKRNFLKKGSHPYFVIDRGNSGHATLPKKSDQTSWTLFLSYYQLKTAVTN